MKNDTIEDAWKKFISNLTIPEERIPKMVKHAFYTGSFQTMMRTKAALQTGDMQNVVVLLEETRAEIAEYSQHIGAKIA